MTTNSTTIAGNLTREPELRFTQAGRAVCSLGVAVNRRYQQNGEWVDGPTSFYNVTVWGQLGENVAASLAKGNRVIVSGRMEQREYEASDGTKRTAWDLIADEVGASLTYATAQVARTERTTSDRPPHPADTATSSPAPAADPIYGEEPFVSLYDGHHSYANMAVTEPWM